MSISPRYMNSGLILTLLMPWIGGSNSLKSSISTLQVGVHTGHFHKCIQSSFSWWHALHAVFCPPFPLRYSALCKIFLNHEDVSLFVPSPLVRFSPIARHGISIPRRPSQFFMQFGASLFRAIRVLYISLTPIWSSGLFPGEFSNVHWSGCGNTSQALPITPVPILLLLRGGWSSRVGRSCCLERPTS